MLKGVNIAICRFTVIVTCASNQLQIYIIQDTPSKFHQQVRVTIKFARHFLTKEWYDTVASGLFNANYCTICQRESRKLCTSSAIYFPHQWLRFDRG